MTPIVSVVGSPGCGKTALLEGLIALLTAKGYRIGTIKRGTLAFPPDQEGSDSRRHVQAGAEVAIASTGQGLGILRRLDREMGLEEMVAACMPEVDLVLLEGLEGERIPRIEIRREQPGEGSWTGEPEGLLAVISDAPLPAKVPLFSPGNPQGVAALLEEKFLRGRSREELHLLVDGRRVPLNPFVHDLFHSLLLAMMAPLKGIGSFSHLTLHLRGPNQKRVTLR